MAETDPRGRRTYTTRTTYEFQLGYSRAIRVGDVIRVAGTAGLREDGQVVSDDVIEQMRRALEIIREALGALGATMEDIVMTRVYVSDVRNIDSVAVVHGDVFRDVRPASTIVKVEFVDPRILVEVEAEAIVQEKKEKVK